LYKGLDTLKFNDIKEAFAAARLEPMFTDKEFKDIFAALEVYKDEEAGTIVWRDILNAMHTREPTAVRGIFPKIVSRLCFLTFVLETTRDLQVGPRGEEKARERVDGGLRAGRQGAQAEDRGGVEAADSS